MKGIKLSKILNESKEQRYVATLEFFIFANDEQSAQDQINDIIKDIDKKDEGREATLTELGIKPFGSSSYRKIK